MPPNADNFSKSARDLADRTAERMGFAPGTAIFAPFLRRKPLASKGGKPLQGLRSSKGSAAKSYSSKMSKGHGKPPWLAGK